MDDHRRTPDGYAPTVAAPSGAMPQAPSGRVSQVADTELAVGTGLRGGRGAPGGKVEQTGPVVGGMIGSYTIHTTIGSDPIGVVYACRDATNRLVAVKLVHAAVAHAPYRSRLVRDAPGLAQLAHPSLVPIDEIGVAFGRPFIAMELVEGPLLAAWLQDPHAWDAIVNVFAEIGGALATAHRAGYGHGDWTMACVLVEPSGRPRMMDIGLGRFDPEGKGVVDVRVDQLRWAVALRGALGGGSEGDPARWAEVPEAVRAVVLRAVDVASPQRFGSMTEVVDALDAARGRRSSPASRGPRADVAAPAPAATSGGHAARTVGLALLGVALVGGAMAAAYAVLAHGAHGAQGSDAAPVVAASAPAPAPAPSVTATPIPLPSSPMPTPTPAPTPLPVTAAHSPTPAPPPAAGPHPVLAAATAGPTEPPVAPPASVAVAPAGAVSVAPAPPLAASDAHGALLAAVRLFGSTHLSDDSGGDPESVEGHNHLTLGIAARSNGKCRDAVTEWKDALLAFEKAANQTLAQRSAAHVDFEIGLCAVATGDYRGAIERLVPAVSLLPEDGLDFREALFAEGLAYWQLDDKPDASRVIRRALALANADDPVQRAMRLVQDPLFGGPL